MGMLATVINALALQDSLEAVGQPTRVQTAITMAQVPSPSSRAAPSVTSRRARRRVRGGTAIRTSPPTPPRRCGRRDRRSGILKGTHSGVDGVYSADPRLDPTAVKLTR